MTMNRRGFLGSILALGAAPAIVRADALMRIIPRDASVLYVLDSSVQFYESDLALTLDEFSSRYIQPAMAIIRQDIENEMLSLCGIPLSGLRPAQATVSRLSKFERGDIIEIRRPR